MQIIILKLKAGKTKCRIISRRKQHETSKNLIPTPLFSKYILGLYFICQICLSCHNHIRNLRRICCYLPLSVAQSIAVSLFTSRRNTCIILVHNIARKYHTTCDQTCKQGLLVCLRVLSLYATFYVFALACRPIWY